MAGSMMSPPVSEGTDSAGITGRRVQAPGEREPPKAPWELACAGGRKVAVRPGRAEGKGAQIGESPELALRAFRCSELVLQAASGACSGRAAESSFWAPSHAGAASPKMPRLRRRVLDPPPVRSGTCVLRPGVSASWPPPNGESCEGAIPAVA